MRAPSRVAGGNLSSWQLPLTVATMGMLLYLWWAFRGSCGASRGGAAAAQDTADAVVVPIADLEDMYQISLREHAKEWERLKNKMTAIDRWDVFGPTYPCMPRERIGSVTDGGKWTCGLRRLLETEPCHVFSLGSHGLVDFEEALLSKFPHCKIHVYDHTLTKEESDRVKAVKGCELHQVGITSNRNLADPDFQPEHRWTSISQEMDTLHVPWYRLLKMDIEGSEFAVFEDYFERNDTLPFTEILVELHAHWLPKTWGADQTLRLKYFFDRMAEQQYRVANNELNLQTVNMKHDVLIPHVVEYTFIKINERGRMILGREDL